MAKIKSELAKGIQKALYMCFIDYTNTFNKLQHKEFLQHKKDTQITHHLY